VIIQWVQAGFLWLPHKVIPDLRRMDPMQGWQRLTAPAQLVRLLLLAMKLIVVSGLAGRWLWHDLDQVRALAMLQPAEMLDAGSELLLHLMFSVGLALLAMGVLDYIWQWWKHERELRMTPDEWREDVKSVHNEVTSLRRRRRRGDRPWERQVDS
jgi:flagellar biosynthetic protein FlhB